MIEFMISNQFVKLVASNLDPNLLHVKGSPIYIRKTITDLLISRASLMKVRRFTFMFRLPEKIQPMRRLVFPCRNTWVMASWF